MWEYMYKYITEGLSIEMVRQIKDIIYAVPIFCLTMAIFVQLYLRIYKYFAHRLVLYTRIATILQCASLLVDDGKPGPKCSFTAFLFHYSGYSQQLWICMLTTSLALNMFKQYQFESHEGLMRVLCFFVCPVVMAMLPLFTDDYQVNGLTCGVTDSEWGQFWTYKILIPPIGLITIYITLTNIYMRYTLRHWIEEMPELADSLQNLSKEFLQPLLWLNGISIVLNLPRIWIKMNALSNKDGNLHYLFYSISLCAYSLAIAVPFLDYSAICAWFHLHQQGSSSSVPGEHQAYITKPSDSDCIQPQQVPDDVTVAPTQQPPENVSLEIEPALDASEASHF